MLKQLVRESMYVIDERAIADAILARAAVRATLPVSTFRPEGRERSVRSFRRDRDARSFRLSGTPHLRAPHR